jgi:hypothetical protein
MIFIGTNSYDTGAYMISRSSAIVMIQNILWSGDIPNMINGSGIEETEGLERIIETGEEIMNGVMTEIKKEMMVTKKHIIVARSTDINSS